MIAGCSFGELMIGALARTVEDGTLVFHGYGSPLVQIALHVAKRTHAPNMVLVAGATTASIRARPFSPRLRTIGSSTVELNARSTSASCSILARATAWAACSSPASRSIVGAMPM